MGLRRGDPMIAYIEYFLINQVFYDILKGPTIINDVPRFLMIWAIAMLEYYAGPFIIFHYGQI